MSFDWLSELKDSQSYWYDPNPSTYHAVLSEGDHSNGYINLRSFAKKRPRLMRQIIYSFYEKYEQELVSLLSHPGIDYVHGPAMGGVIPAFEIANLLGVGYLYTEKVESLSPDGRTTKIVCNFDDLESSRVVCIEDVLSTGGTNAKSIQALTQQGATIVGPLFVLVNRSGKSRVQNQDIRALLELSFETHKPSQCPWCKSGSQAVKPKLLWKQFSS